MHQATTNVPASASSGAEVPHSYPPTAPVQSQTHVGAPTLGPPGAQGPHRMNVAKQVFNYFNQAPRPVPATMPQGRFPHNLENRSLPRSLSHVEQVPMPPVLPTPNVRRREREPPAASSENTPFEGQVTAERVTKVQLVEQESLQVTEQLTRQAAAIERLTQQVSWGTAILCVVLMTLLAGRT